MSSENKKPQEGIRLQKFLSLAGISSRRHAEELIQQGRVKISGRVVTEMGVRVIPGKSRVEVDNKPVFYSEERNYVLFHKPAECITTLDDPEQRTTVIDLLPKSMPRVFPVGRLDWDTEGLLLLTNDGDLAYKLTHPAAKVPRIYHAKVRGELKEDSPELKKLQNGVELEDGLAKPDRVSVIKFTGNNTWLEIELHIGRNRIVRRMCDAIGYPVMKLRRVAFGNLTLDGLSLGAFRDLTEQEVAELYKMVGDPSEVPTVRSKKGVRFARGFDPKERTMPRQAAPSKESLEIADRKKSKFVVNTKSHAKFEKDDDNRRVAKEDRRFSDKSRDDRRSNRSESPRFAHDENRSFNASWDTPRRDERPAPRNEDKTERRAFPRNDKDERRSFPRNDKDERRSFPRNDKDERRSFPRNDKDERRSFPRKDQDERRSFPRNDKDERRSFPRNDKEDRRSFPRNDKDERRSFPRNDKDERRSFPRNDKDERRSFPRNEDHRDRHSDRDDHKQTSGDKKRPFARGVTPHRRPRS
ncbi:MAG: pseudouridine synthase [Proteobacteria bacterium]|nr:pseudouridine synthase [Pseudomonadota bacterium]